MSKKKYAIIFIIITFVLLTIFLISCRKDNTLIWITNDSIEDISEDLENELNILLKDKGTDIKVKFVCFPIDTYEEEVKAYLKENKADIIYSNLRIVGDYFNNYFTFYKGGYLENISRIREDNSFYSAYPETTWKTMEIEHDIYGVPAYQNGGMGFYYIINEKYVDKYNLDISSISKDIDSLQPILKTVADHERNSLEFIPLLPFEYLFFAPGYSELIEFIMIKENQEKIEVKNILKEKEYKEFLMTINKYYQNGLIKEPNDNTIGEGKFFINIVMGESEKKIIEYYNTYCKEQGYDTLKLRVIPVGNQFTSYRTGGMNSVLKGEKKEDAIELLKLTATDLDISNLLKYGNENIGYTPEMMRWNFGNDTLEDIHIESKVECSKMGGFQFDGMDFKEVIDKMNTILFEYIALLRGVSDNPLQDYEKLLTELDTIGSEAVINEINVQLKEWHHSE